MKLQVLLILGISFFAIQLSLAQRGGAKIAYIDSEYILKNVPEYQQATSQLASKVEKWKVEVEGKLNKIKQQRVALTNEKALLTQELYDERLEDLEFEEKEIVEYQQKRFGPNGDLVIQRKQLMQPVQDQIFQAVQDISEKRNYDFVFDKSADVVMLYSAEKYDISDVVLRLITRSSKRKQAESRKERREAEEEIAIEEEKSDSQIERQRILDEKKAKRDSVYAAKRAALKAERDAARAAKLKQRKEELKAKEAAKESGSNEKKANEDEDNSTEKQDAPKSREQLLEEKRAAREADKKRRQKALEDKRKAREEELKKAREEKDKDNPK